MWWSGCNLWFWLVASLTQRLQLLIHLQRRRSVWRLLKSDWSGGWKTIESSFWLNRGNSFVNSMSFFSRSSMLWRWSLHSKEQVSQSFSSLLDLEKDREMSQHFDLSLSFSNVDEWSISFSWIFLFRSQENVSFQDMSPRPCCSSLTFNWPKSWGGSLEKRTNSSIGRGKEGWFHFLFLSSQFHFSMWLIIFFLLSFSFIFPFVSQRGLDIQVLYRMWSSLPWPWRSKSMEMQGRGMWRLLWSGHCCCPQYLHGQLGGCWKNILLEDVFSKR